MAVIEAIQTTYLEADVTSVEFASIPATYEHLQIRLGGKDDRGFYIDPANIAFNSDTTASNYTTHVLQANASSASAFGVASGNYLTWVSGLGPTGGTVTAADYGVFVVDILDYVNGNKNTTLAYSSGVLTTTSYVYFASILWDNTAAVDTITLTPRNSTNFVRGSVFTLYGLNSS